MPTPPDTTGRLGAREAELLAGILSGQTVTEAGKSAGVSRSATYRIWKKESFQTVLQAARSELLESTIDKLRGLGADAANTLGEVFKDSAPKPQSGARVSAARETFAALFKGIEI